MANIELRIRRLEQKNKEVGKNMQVLIPKQNPANDEELKNLKIEHLMKNGIEGAPEDWEWVVVNFVKSPEREDD